MSEEKRQRLSLLIENLKINRDPTHFFERYLFIKTKAADIAPFILRPEQIRLQRVIDNLRAEGKPVRVIILKARQIGFSTLCQANIFKATATSPNVTSQIVAHDTDSADHLFSMSRLFYDMLPPALRPMIRYSNRKELLFENPREKERKTNPGLRSKVVVDTASTLTTGRALTIHNLHCSELPQWRDPEVLMLGLMQAVPRAPNTMVFWESTAHGFGDFFHTSWEEAQRGESEFYPFFSPWHSFDEYQAPLDEKWNKYSKDSYEIEIQKKFNLSDEQLYWRRLTIENQCQKDADLFKQEYPMTPEEAFLTWGNPVFIPDILEKMMLRTKEPEFVGEVIKTKTGFLYTPMNRGQLKMWQYPKKKVSYVIGADVAEGLMIKGRETDFSAVEIFRRDTLEQVAEWHGRIAPDEFGRMCALLGLLYNKALLGIEANQHGWTAIGAIKDEYKLGKYMQQPYSNLYITEQHDQRGRIITKKLGWLTTTKTRRLMIDALAAVIREEEVKINSKELIKECLSFVKDSAGKPQAAQGAFDDRVMASAIAMKINEETIGETKAEVYEQEETSFSLPQEFAHQKKKVLMPEKEKEEESWEAI